MSCLWYLSLLCLLTLSACGKGLRGSNITDPEFEQYLVTFDESAPSRTRSLQSISGQVKIEFGELPRGEHARCEKSAFESSIKVDRVLWEGKPESWRELLIFHEVGHCVLGLAHSLDASDVMYKDVGVSHQRYTTHREEMLDRFFSALE